MNKTHVRAHSRGMKLHDFKLAGLRREKAAQKNLSIKFYGKNFTPAWDKEVEYERQGIRFDGGAMVFGAKQYREWNIDWSFKGTPSQRRKVIAWAKAHGGKVSIEKPVSDY